MELTLVAHVDIDAEIERALLYDKSEEAARLSQGLESAIRVFESWVLRSHGRVLSQEGCNWSAQVPAEYLEELPDICRQVEEATKARVQVGVGAEPSEAVIAKRIAEERGGDPAIVLYTPDLSEEARQLDEMSDDEADVLDGGFPDGGIAKAEGQQREPGEASQIAQGTLSPSAATPSAPDSPSISAGSPSPDGQQGAPQGQPGAQGEPSEQEVLQAVGQVLSQFKAQLPFFEQQVKQANPQAYQAVMGMVQGMVAMAQHLASGAPPQPEVRKSEQTKVELEPDENIPSTKTLRKLYDDVSDSTLAMAESDAAEKGFKEFAEGFRHEKEEHPHLDDRDTALTTYQHLAEDPQYYSKLKGLEESGAIGEKSLDKAGIPASRHHLVLPPGSVGVGSKAHSVKVVEPATGKASWHQVSSGQTMSSDRHPISPRVGECPSADTPQRRAAQAGLVGAPTIYQEKPPQTAKMPGK